MDHSSPTSFEVLQKLKASISDCDELRSILSIATNIFSKAEDVEILPEIISVLLGPAAQSLPLDQVDVLLLEPFFPSIKLFMSKKLSENHKIVSESWKFGEESFTEKIIKNLEICIQILSDIDGLLCHLLSLERTPVSALMSAPKNIAEVVCLVFCHCHKSKEDYKEAFSDVRSQLLSLFQQSHQVQVKLYSLLNEKLVFKCTFEDEMQLLVDVLDILHSMAEIVAQLDTMSLVTHWKGYVQLTQTYSNHLCHRLDVARPITYLTINISHQLANIKVYVNADMKVLSKALKVSGLQLKVLIKLCEHYKGYLGECHTELLNCLVALCAHTSQYLLQEGLQENMAAQVTSQLSAGAAPLTFHLLSDPVFVQAYLHHGETLASKTLIEKVGFCHLTNLILKKLIQQSSLDKESKELWFKSTLPLVNIVFSILKDGEIIFFSTEEDIYQSLVIHTAGFLFSVCTAEMFPELEILLIKQLMQPLLWPALFSSDILCLVARVGSSQLCQQLVTLLYELCSSWPPYDRCRPEWHYISWTLGRLSSFLASDDLKMFPSLLPSLTTISNDIASLIEKPFSDDSLAIYNSLMDKMSLVKDHLHIFSVDEKATLMDPVCRLWQHLYLTVQNHDHHLSIWFHTFFSVLTTVTSQLIESFNNIQILNVLNVLEETNKLSVAVFQCGACEILRRLAAKTFDGDLNQTNVCQKISLLFVQLLQNTDPIVNQIAFETFSYLAYVTKYEKIVADTVANNVLLQNRITDYLEGTPTVKSDVLYLDYIQSLKCDFVHKCKSQSKIRPFLMENPSEQENPLKKLKVSSYEESVDAALERIEKDLSIVEKCNINENQSTTLQRILKRIGEIVNKT